MDNENCHKKRVEEENKRKKKKRGLGNLPEKRASGMRGLGNPKAKNPRTSAKGRFFQSKASQEKPTSEKMPATNTYLYLYGRVPRGLFWAHLLGLDTCLP